MAGRRPPRTLPRPRYTGMVFKEALRLCPPAWALNKRNPVEDVELGGYRIRRGSGIFIMPYVMHHQERYFPDPFRFDPERFTLDPGQRVALQPLVTLAPKYELRLRVVDRSG